MEQIKENEWRLSKNEVLVKKGDQHKIIYPYKIDGKINWKNLLLGGSWKNFIIVLVVVSLLLFLAWSYDADTEKCRDIIENPQDYCSTMYCPTIVKEESSLEIIIPNLESIELEDGGYNE